MHKITIKTIYVKHINIFKRYFREYDINDILKNNKFQ